MHLRVIACEVLARQIYHCAAKCPHIVDVELLKKGLHDRPDVLRTELQRRIDQVSADEYDAILLGYGLCSNSAAGLVARGLPLVIARAHDCITLYLGSKERYMQEFSNHPGTYYYTADYIERGGKGDGSVALGSGEGALRSRYEELVEKYGEENARYLMEVATSWTQHYSCAAFIEMGLVPFLRYDEFARSEAQGKGLTYQELAGDTGLIARLLAGEWKEEDFLVVPPDGSIVATYNERIIASADGSAPDS